MDYSTRISDLPENITLGHSGGFSQGSQNDRPQGPTTSTFGQGDRSQGMATFALDNGLDLPTLSTTYTQMNVHPDP